MLSRILITIACVIAAGPQYAKPAVAQTTAAHTDSALPPPATLKTARGRQYREIHMGVETTLVIYGGEEDAANDAARRAFARIAELNRIFSDYDAESEAMRLCRNAVVGRAETVSDDLWTVLNIAADLSRRTDGAFDVSVGPVSKLWRRARRRGELPPADLLAQARERVGWKYLELHPDTRTVSLQRDELQLDFGGIVKGYAADAACQVLKDAGFPRSMVGLAGDMAFGEAPPGETGPGETGPGETGPGETGWSVRIAALAPQGDGIEPEPLRLSNCAVSTSGDAFQFVEIDGVRYSHIVDPRTGIGLRQRSSVTVIARRGIDADSLATAATVLGPDRGLKLIEQAGAAAMYRIADGEQIRSMASKNWPQPARP